MTSRFGPIFAALQSVKLQSYIGKPSWCSATGTTYRAPEALKSEAHSPASNFSALNIGMKSLYPNSDCGPQVSTWWANSFVSLLYMLRGYHSLPNAGTE